jgi:hypothetical protein
MDQTVVNMLLILQQVFMEDQILHLEIMEQTQELEHNNNLQLINLKIQQLLVVSLEI